MISDTQESMGFAVQQTCPTVPHQIGQEHELHEGAPPVCAADRHVTKALQKQVRGVRAVERQAAQALTQEAPRGADDGFSLRTVMRDEGKSPLQPPGVPL